MLEATGDLAENPESRFGGFLRLDVAVDQEGDQCEEQDDEGHTKSGDEEPHLLLVGLLLDRKVAGPPQNVEENQRRDTHSRINFCFRQCLQGVDKDQVGSLASVDSTDSEKSRNLTNGDRDGGSSHEGSNGDKWDELDDPSPSNNTDKKENRSANDRQSTGDLFGGNIGVDILDSENDISDDLRHDSDGLQLN